jgi:hypothetical protein
LILTAQHCSEAGAAGRHVLDLTGTWHEAEVVWASPNAEVDLALWRVGDFGGDPTIPLAGLNRRSGGDVPATGYGFPVFLQGSHRRDSGAQAAGPTPADARRLEQLTGHIPLAQGLSAGVPVSPFFFVTDTDRTVMPRAERPKEESAPEEAQDRVEIDWGSLSGTAILVDQTGERHCVGVVRGLNRTHREGTFEVTGFDSLTQLDPAEAAGFWALVDWVRPDTMPVIRGDARERPVWLNGCPAQAAHYVPRQASQELEQALPSSHRATLWGMKGAGKSQVAAALVRHRVEDGWPEVFWVNAETRGALLEELKLIALMLEQSTRVAQPGRSVQNMDPEAAAKQLINHWNGHPNRRRLIVFDNLTDKDDLADLQLGPGAATVVFTTADRGATPNQDQIPPIEVGPFTHQEALAYLTARTGLNASADPAASLVTVNLSCLPLALAQAAGVIRLRRRDDPSYDYTSYLADLKDTAPEDALQLDGDYPNHTTQAIRLARDTALQAAADRSQSTEDVITVLAFLDPAGVRRAHLSPLTEGRSGKGDLAKVLDLLEGVSLITRSASPIAGSPQTITMHRLVSWIIRHDLDNDPGDTTGPDPDATDPTLQPIIKVLDAIEPVPVSPDAPPPDRDTYPARRQEAGELAAHLAWLLRQRPTADQNHIILRIRIYCGRALVNLHDPFTAIAVLTAAHTTATELQGPDHPNTLAARNTLANAHQDAGHTDQAITLHQQNLTDSERVLGPDHPDTLGSRNNLAEAHRAAGHLAQAIHLHEQNLTDRERVLGPDHPNTLGSRNNLAEAHQDAGHTDQAITLHQQNLADRERVLGPDHPNTLTTRNNLARALWNSGRQDEAREQMAQAVRDSESLSPDHEVRRVILRSWANMERH